MFRTKKNSLIIQGLLLVALVVSWNMYFQTATEHDSVSISDFPKTIGTWVSEDLPIPESDLSMLETKNAFVRRYTNTSDGTEVYLFLVYSQHNRRVAHPPEICYLGSGISIIQNVHDPIKVEYKNLTIPTNRLKLLRSSYEHISFYWFKVGDRFTANYWHQQILIALSAISGNTSGSALIRISADVVNDDQEKAIKSIKSFTNVIASALYQYLP